jgi:CspA family cold shock protein
MSTTLVSAIAHSDQHRQGKSRPVLGRRQFGKVKWFDLQKGYGFIIPDTGGADVFVHYTALPLDGDGAWRGLSESERVSYILAKNNKGFLAMKVQEEG